MDRAQQEEPAAAGAPGPAAAIFEGLQDAFNDKVIQFTNYFDRDFKENNDQTHIKEMVRASRRRLIVDMDDLRHHDRALAESLLKTPIDYLPAIERALRDIVIATYNPERSRVMQENVYHIGFKGSFGDHHVNPRTLSASNLGHMVALEGIVTRVSLVRPKMVKSVHYCDRTNLFHTREYRDSTMVSSADPHAQLPTGTSYPTEDENGNPLTTEFGYCTFRDHQTLAIQEMPERAPPGQLPRSVDVVLDDDLVDACKPGDRVQLVGVYRAVGGASGHSSFRTLLVAVHVRHLDREVAQPTLTDTDVNNIRRIARRKNVLDLLSRSLAPSIFGHPFIKRAILLLLLGGLEHNLENGTHIRGDINMLLLGDPSTAKSQFLRFVMHIAPLAIATTGRGSSGVGLTAAVTQDKETGERRLEAGAMVLADRGVVCIDEFDKMSEADRVAIHEVMEQQTITIAKAGIHTSLNARCSVIAAANPTYGQYDEHLEPHRNIRLPDSLLSRFDLLFVILDKTDEAMDRKLSSHVLKMHRYLPPGLEEGQPLPASADNQYLWLDDAPTKEIPVFEKVQSGPAAGARAGRGGKATGKDEVLSLGFLKKYIHYAKSRVKPQLTPAACETITAAYARFRHEKAADDAGRRRTLPVTARTLETLIRLATAHAKARLARTVEASDADAAAELLEFALFKEFRRGRKARANKKRRTDGTAGDDDESDSDEEDGDDNKPQQRQQGTTRRTRGAAAAAAESQDTMDVDAAPPTTQQTSGTGPGLSALLDSSQATATTGIAAGAAAADSAMAEGEDGDEGDEEHLDAADARATDIAVFDAAKYAEFRRRLDAVFQEYGGSAAIVELPRLINHKRFMPQGGAEMSAAEVHLYLERLEADKGVFADTSSGHIYRI